MSLWPFSVTLSLIGAESDLIVESTLDATSFRVHKLILSIASPMLQDRISSLTPGPSSDHVAILKLDEPGTTLELLLQLCYPVTSPIIIDLPQLEMLLSAALKYSMAGASEKLRNKLSMNFVDSDPVGVYGVACRLKLDAEARQALKLVTTSPRKPKALTSEQLIQRITAQPRLLNPGICAVEYIPLLGLPNAPANEVFSWNYKKWSTPMHSVQAPFARSHLGDVVLRSSDELDFHVSKAVLSFASPVFCDMFTLPQPPQDSQSLQVIDMSEDSSTLDWVLRLSYPIRAPLPTNLSVIYDVLKAALKYDLDAVVVSIKEKMFQEFSSRDPAGLYAVCCSLGLDQEMKDAAFLCLSITQLQMNVSMLWRLVNSEDYLRLRVYRINCCHKTTPVAEMQETVGFPSWYTLGTARNWIVCEGDCAKASGTNFKACWMRYMAETRQLLRASPACPSIVSFDRLFTRLASGACSVCAGYLTADMDTMRGFCDEMGQEIRRRINEVTL